MRVSVLKVGGWAELMRESIVGDCPTVTVQDHSCLPLTDDIMHDAKLSAADRYELSACSRMSEGPLNNLRHIEPSSEEKLKGLVTV